MATIVIDSMRCSVLSTLGARLGGAAISRLRMIMRGELTAAAIFPVFGNTCRCSRDDSAWRKNPHPRRRRCSAVVEEGGGGTLAPRNRTSSANGGSNRMLEAGTASEIASIAVTARGRKYSWEVAGEREGIYHFPFRARLLELVARATCVYHALFLWGGGDSTLNESNHKYWRRS